LVAVAAGRSVDAGAGRLVAGGLSRSVAGGSVDAGWWFC
jgi:hypothetical protein